jgi:Flp pilus assembly pilin Flp
LPQRIHTIARRTYEREEAQTMVEYTLVLGVITVAIVLGFGLSLATAIEGVFQEIAGLFS